MKKTEEDFYQDNLVYVGKDFQSFPPLYYHSLHEGMRGWCSIDTSFKQSVTGLLFHDWTREGISFNFNNCDMAVTTILGLHRFFELLIKDVLRRIDPFLAVKFLEGEKQVVKFLNDELSAEDVNTIEFAEAHRRLREAITYAKQHPEKVNYQLALKFEFLVEEQSLSTLARWRNRISHNGNTLPNVLSLEYMMSQKILPLIANVLEADKEHIQGFRPHYFTTPSGTDIFSELLSVKFDYHGFYEKPFPRDIVVGMLRIAHLKELMRSCYLLDPLVPKNGSFHQPYYENPLERSKRFVEAEKANPHFLEVLKCPCCGIESLIVYRKQVPDMFNNWVPKNYDFSKCLTCDYLMPENMGDPYQFGLYPHRIFHREEYANE